MVFNFSCMLFTTFRQTFSIFHSSSRRRLYPKDHDSLDQNPKYWSAPPPFFFWLFRVNAFSFPHGILKILFAFCFSLYHIILIFYVFSFSFIILSLSILFTLILDNIFILVFILLWSLSPFLVSLQLIYSVHVWY